MAFCLSFPLSSEIIPSCRRCRCCYDCYCCPYWLEMTIDGESTFPFFRKLFGLYTAAHSPTLAWCGTSSLGFFLSRGIKWHNRPLRLGPAESSIFGFGGLCLFSLPLLHSPLFPLLHLLPQQGLSAGLSWKPRGDDDRRSCLRGCELEEAALGDDDTKDEPLMD